MMTATKTRQSRKQPQAVHGLTSWIGGAPTQFMLDNGDALLRITVTGKEASFYGVSTLCDEDGCPVGYQLSKLDGKAETYVIDATTGMWHCNCADATYTPRPGGCKHVCGLRAALTAAGLIISEAQAA